MTVDFFPMAEMLAVMRPEFDEAFRRVLASGKLILGREVEAFEQEFAAYCGVGHCVGVGNGLDALAIALKSQGVQPGDEVIVPGHTFIASWLAVSQIGAIPMPADIDPVSFNLDPDSVASAVTPRTVAIMPVHLYGNPAPMDEISAIADRYGLFVLEDAAQAHGATYRLRRTGSLGHAAGFSFYPTKNLAALGDGGAIVTDDAEIAERARRYRNYGSSGKYVHAAGTNSRLDELQAAFLRARLRRLDRDNARRREIAALYRNRLSGIEGLTLPQSDVVLGQGFTYLTSRSGVFMQTDAGGTVRRARNVGQWPKRVLRNADLAPKGARYVSSHVYHLFVVRTPHRDRLASGLASRGIGTMVHYPRPPHLQPAFADRLSRISLPITELVADEVLSLPMSPVLDEADVYRVAVAVRKVLN